MSDTLTLGFDEKYVEDILSGEKRTTWRVDHHGVVKPGDLISLHSGEYTQFGIGTVVWSKTTEVRYISEEDMKYHESYETTEEIIEALEEHYDHLEISPSTRVVVVRFRLEEDLTQ